MPDPRRNTRALLTLTTYLERPRTLAEIAARYRLSKRTAYRWLEYLREDGVVVVSLRRQDGARAFRTLYT